MTLVLKSIKKTFSTLGMITCMGNNLKFKATKLLVFGYLLLVFFGGFVIFMVRDLIKRPKL